MQKQNPTTKVIDARLCEHPKVGKDRFCADCKKRNHKIAIERWNANHPNYYIEYRKKNRKKHLNYLTNYRKIHKKELEEYREINRIYHREYERKAGKQLRLEVLRHYSPELKCIECNENDIDTLSIDHINQIGRKHREEIGGHLYRWLKKNNYPIGFQVLCMNCQFIKEFEKRRIKLNFKNSQKAMREDKRKIKAIEIYSNGKMKCSSCSQNNLMSLSIDHIKNKGSKHRREFKIQGRMFYLWLSKNGYPKGYQVLCMNCNIKKARADRVWNKT